MAMMELMKAPDISAQALATAFPGPTGWSRLPVVELPEPDELGPIPGALARLGQAGALAVAPLLDHPDSDTRYLALLDRRQPALPRRGRWRDARAVRLRARHLVGGARGGGGAAAAPALPVAAAGAAAGAGVVRCVAPQPRGPRAGRAARSGVGRRADQPHRQRRRSLRPVGRRRAQGDHPGGLRHQPVGVDRLVGARARPAPHRVVGRSARRRGLRPAALAAIEELSRTFGDNFGFFADGPEAERAGAVGRWKAVVASRADLDL